MAAEGSGVDAIAGRAFCKDWEGFGQVEAVDRFDGDQVARAAEVKVCRRRLAELLPGVSVKRKNIVFAERHPHPKLRRFVRPAAKFFKVSVHD